MGLVTSLQPEPGTGFTGGAITPSGMPSTAEHRRWLTGYGVLTKPPGERFVYGSPKENHSPPPLDKGMLLGKWEAEEPEQLIQAFEFGADKSLRMWLKQVPDPVSGTYDWSGHASLTNRCAGSRTLIRSSSRRRSTCFTGSRTTSTATTTARSPWHRTEVLRLVQAQPMTSAPRKTSRRLLADCGHNRDSAS